MGQGVQEQVLPIRVTGPFAHPSFSLGIQAAPSKGMTLGNVALKDEGDPEDNN